MPRSPIDASASRQPCGPAPQLTPIASTSNAASAAAAAAGVVPSGRAISSPNVREATMGRSAAACRASSMAIARWSSDENVSSMNRSTPPSSRPSMASRNAPRTWARIEVDEVAGRGAERTDGPGDQDVAAGHVAGLPGDLGAAPRQPAGLVGEPVRREADPVRPERRGLDQVSARREVLAMDRADQLGSREDQLVERGTLRDPAREQQRAHRAVGQQRPLGQAIAEPSRRIHARTIADAS